MSTYTEFTESLRDQIVDSIKEGEERGLQAVSSVTSLIEKVLPAASTVEAAGTKYFPFVKSLPGAGKLRPPADVLASNAAFLERLVKAQTTFAVTLLEAGR